MSEKRLSICIVNWNTRDLLKDCLQSIYDDSESSQWEVIVVDNAPADHLRPPAFERNDIYAGWKLEVCRRRYALRDEDFIEGVECKALAVG